MTRLAMTRDEAITATGLIVLGAVACLSPVHNDTWWHLAYGREMAAAGGFGNVDRFSFTAYGNHFTNHQWLAQRLFFWLWSVGGLPLVTAWCAATIVAGWALCWRLTRGPLVDRLLATGIAAAGSTMVWSVRPQVFSIALLPLVVTLLVHRRYAWVPPVMLLWANVHGGVLLGLVAIGVWTVVAAIYARNDVPRLALTGLASLAAMLMTPLGWRYPFLLMASLERSRLNGLQEWVPPGWPPQQPLFWLAAAAVVVAVVRQWRTGLPVADRGLLLFALVLLASAVRALRNIAAFMMMAAPVLSRWLASRARPAAAEPHPRWSVVPAAALVGAALVVGSAWSRPWPALGWQPLDAAEAAAIAACPGPIYNTYSQGGPIIWFVPSQPVMIDSRQDHLPDGFVREATAIEDGGDPSALIRRLAIRCAVLPLESPTAGKLISRSWTERFRSFQWIVLEAPAASAVSIPQPR